MKILFAFAVALIIRRGRDQFRSESASRSSSRDTV